MPSCSPPSHPCQDPSSVVLSSHSIAVARIRKTALGGLPVPRPRFLFTGNLHYFYFLINLILPEAVYTAVLTFAVYRILFSVNEHIETKEKHKRRLFIIK